NLEKDAHGLNGNASIEEPRSSWCDRDARMIGRCRDRSSNCRSSPPERPWSQQLKSHGSRALNCILLSMGAMNMNNESNRVVPNFHSAYDSRIKGASVYLHDREVETAISESIFEDGSRREKRHRTAAFMRLAGFFFL